MEDCVNKNLDETHTYIFEHDIETNWDAMKMVIEEFVYGHDDDKIKKNPRKNDGVIQIFVTENEK